MAIDACKSNKIWISVGVIPIIHKAVGPAEEDGRPHIKTAEHCNTVKRRLITSIRLGVMPAIGDRREGRGGT
jgi:hypothetical protein